MNIREELINEEIRKIESNYVGLPIKMNTTDFLIGLKGDANYNKYYLIIAGKIFKERGWYHRRDKNKKRYYEYNGKINDGIIKPMMWA